MPAGAVGSCWAEDSWSATAWETDTWANVAAVPEWITVENVAYAGPQMVSVALASPSMASVSFASPQILDVLFQPE